MEINKTRPYVKLSYFTRKCTIVWKVFDSHTRKQIILQLKSVKFEISLRVIFALTGNAALITSLLDCVGFEFLWSEYVQLRERNLPTRWWKAQVL